MACPYPSYLKQSLGQTLLYKILSHPKTIPFSINFSKIHSIPIYILSSCLLCILYFKINFHKNFNLNKTVFPFLAGGGDHPPPPWRFVKDKAYLGSQVAPSR
jgi:hypothetical protein